MLCFYNIKPKSYCQVLYELIAYNLINIVAEQMKPNDPVCYSYYMNDPNTQDQNSVAIAEKMKPDFSAEELSFMNLVAKGYSQTQAYRMAFPAKSKLKASTLRNYAMQLMTKNDILQGIETAKLTQARLARMAENRIEQILTEGSIHSKTNKVADVSMFMYEQANGKATIKQEIKSAHVVAIYDLTGTGETMPDEIRQQLEAIN